MCQTQNHATCTVHFCYVSDHAINKYSLRWWSDVVSTVIHESSRTALECALRFISEHMQVYIRLKGQCIFFLQGKKKYLITNHAKPMLCKNVIRNTDYGARKLCLFTKSWWNFNVVKIIRIFYSLLSIKIYCLFVSLKRLIWSEYWRHKRQLRHSWNVTRVML